MPTHPIARLYDLADELYRRSPWEWLEEIHLVALRHPESGELAYLSVMGHAGSHRALAVYIGEAAIERFNRIHSDDPGTEQDGMRLVLESRQLQLSFNERAILTKADLAEIKALGRKYRGEAWPQMRSYHPGVVAARVSADEVTWLTLAVEQLLAVAPRLQGDPEQTLRHGSKGLEILCRERNSAGDWGDVWIPHHMKSFEFPSPPCDKALAAKVRQHSEAADVECLFTILPNPIGQPGGRCVYPYLLMAVRPNTSIILGVKLLSLEKQTYEELIASVPDCFLELLNKAKVRPLSLDCASVATAQLLQEPAKELGIVVECYEELPLLDQIVATMPF